MSFLNAPVDISADFQSTAHTYFLADQLTAFDLATGAGKVRWERSRYGAGMLFNHMSPGYRKVEGNEWPKDIYAENPELPFSIQYVSANTLRLRMQSSATAKPTSESLMLVRDPKEDGSWQGRRVEGGYEFGSVAGSVFLREKPWRLEVRDAAGRALTGTLSESGQPFCFVRRADNYSRSFSAVFSLASGERIFGCGESFTKLDKRGQKVVLCTTDALSVEKPFMYKPVPFFLSNRGYGMFIHTSSPVTCDFGASDMGRNVMAIGDDELDLFIFLGTPKEIIDSYTGLVGKSPMPPLWTFGLWMSRITYKTEEEVRDVAAKLREHRIPSDVLHLDTGWFETDWQCDYQFSKSRFQNPQEMIDDLKALGLRTCLWQLPYFVPPNRLFPEIVNGGLAVKDAKGNIPYEDAVLDFSNPETVKWYQNYLGNLLRMGVGAIKTDFGEGAPFGGSYASGRTGFYEHNLYPVRYQKAAADLTRQVTGENIIWARAGWAGSQRYPVHWGGDAGKTFSAMAGTLRAGLSLGVCGFSFWSHDIGGFAGANDLQVYRAWVPFGMFTSHARVHGEPPKEPWLLGEEFMNEFRRADEMRYRLMPYIYAQAKDSSERGLPMLRALFIEYPDDPGAWGIEDAYLFGSDLLVAPLFEEGVNGRDVYLPGGKKWIDYQTGRVYPPGWQHIEAGPIRAVLLVRDGAAIPHIAPAQCTRDLDWSRLEFTIFATEASQASALIHLPGDGKLHTVTLARSGSWWVVENDPLSGRLAWSVH